jgi:hypothetical protein
VDEVVKRDSECVQIKQSSDVRAPELKKAAAGEKWESNNNQSLATAEW